MSNQTVVIFRKFKDRGDIVALFPYELNYPNGGCESYQTIGQHGAADYRHCIDISVPATPQEYAPLKRELEQIGYELKVQKRATQWAQRMMNREPWR